MKKSLFTFLAMLLFASVLWAADTTYGPKVYKDSGGDREVVADGGVLKVESGGNITLESGSTLTLTGATSTGGTLTSPVITSGTLSGQTTLSVATLSGGATLSGIFTGGTLASPTVTAPTLSGTVTLSSATLSGDSSLVGTFTGGTLASQTITGATLTTATVTAPTVTLLDTTYNVSSHVFTTNDEWVMSATEAKSILLTITSGDSALVIKAPDVSGRLYAVRNATTGVLTAVTIKKSGGTGISIASGHTALVIHNGSDYIRLTEDQTH